jgi:hypothetical protein
MMQDIRNRKSEVYISLFAISEIYYKSVKIIYGKIQFKETLNYDFMKCKARFYGLLNHRKRQMTKHKTAFKAFDKSIDDEKRVPHRRKESGCRL